MSSNLRLYLNLHVTKLPLVAEIEFPESGAGWRLADLYRDSIKFSENTNKTLETDGHRDDESIVAFKLPTSMHDITYSRTYSSLVLHFETAHDAERFRDPLFSGVPDRPRQVYLKPSWTAEEQAELRRTLDSLVKEADPLQRGGWEDHWEDRAGASPRGDIMVSMAGGLFVGPRPTRTKKDQSTE